MTPLDDLMRKIPAFKEWVPMWARVGIFLFCIMVFQCSGGIYLVSVNEMMGATSLMQEDILMAGYASFIGLTMAFPVLFRLKFRFPTRTILPAVSIGLIVCNLVTMQTRNLPLLAVTCFIAGFLRMWGTFECFSSIQLRITPTRDFAVFFPVIYLSIFGYIQLSGLTATYLTYFYSWRYMHYLAVGLLLAVILLSHLFLRPFYLRLPLPLYGIDWVGLVLWSVVLLLTAFTFNYGDYYDWFDSPYIRLALVCAFFFLTLNLYRMGHIRHPYVEAETFKYKHFFTVMFLFFALNFLTAVSTVLQGVYTGGILHYDTLNNVSLNFPSLLGVGLGAWASWLVLARLRTGYKMATFIGFALVVSYLIIMYFLISPDTNIEKLYLPVVLRNMGNTMIYIVLTTYLSQIIPFRHFFQSLCAVGFVREGIGGPIATAVVSRLFKITVQSNYYTLGGVLDSLNPVTVRLPFSIYFGELQRQVILVSVKEVFGYAVLAGILLLIFILFARYTKVVHRIKVFRVPVVCLRWAFPKREGKKIRFVDRNVTDGLSYVFQATSIGGVGSVPSITVSVFRW